MNTEIEGIDNVSCEELPESELEVWGYSLREFSHRQQSVWHTQERFLSAFRIGGTIKSGLTAVSVCRRTVELWRQSNVLQFAERFQLAHEEFCDSQEDLVYKLNSELKAGQNSLSILATLNANRPSKWRPQSIQVEHSLGQKVMAALQAAQQRDSNLAIDAEYKELPALPDSSDSV
jgi:hypothetical protein